MAGHVHMLIQDIVNQRGGGNIARENNTRTKLMLKGVNPSQFGPTSEDDQEIISKLEQIAKEMGVLIIRL